MRKDIAARLEDIRDLPTLPVVAMRIAQLVDDPAVSMEKASRELSKDQSLTAKILRLVNSPFYGFSGKISSLPHALTLLGVNVVKNAVLSVSILDAFPRKVAGFNPESLWEHAIGTAVAARWLGERAGLMFPDHLFVAGLLHDIGKVFFLRAAPAEFLAAMELAAQEGRPLIEVERARLSTDHAEVGGLIARQWHLPADLTEAVTYHHSPLKATEDVRLAALVHLADVAAYRLAPGGQGGRRVLVDEGALTCLTLKRPILEECASALRTVFDQAKEVLARRN
jgi:HD-like signal output (HDOD) protein